jgi:hypothetical protein
MRDSYRSWLDAVGTTMHHRSLQKKADQTPSLRPVQLQRSPW